MNPLIRAWIRSRITAWLDRNAHDGPFAAVAAFLDGAPPLDAGQRPPPLPDCPRLRTIGECFDLDTDELALLVLGAAPALSVQVHAVFRALRPEAAEGPSLGFICDLAADDAAGSDRLLRLTAQPGGLVEAGLLALRGAGPRGGRAVEVPSSLVAALAGEPVVPSPGLAAALRPAVEPCPWDAASQDMLAPVGRPLALVGGPGSGRVPALAAARGGLMVVDLALLVARGDIRARLDEADRIARLRGGHLVLDLDGVQLDDRDGPGRWLAVPRDVTLLVGGRDQLPPWLLRRVELVDAPRPSAGAAALDWRDALAPWRDRLGGPLLDGPQLDGPQLDLPQLSEALGQRFPLARAAIRQVVDETTPGDLAGLHRAVRRFAPHMLETLADRAESRLTWDDVVLEDSARETLREIELHARRRRQVFDGWGLGRLLPYGRGLACLFSGPPGTGKTMVAGVLARSLDRELYRVDIARVVSKWLGETEKGLARLFDEAERAGAMLFFDEADSLFARRTEVRASNDRHANMAVNYLLQRMEAFDGISILATNIESGIDEAFRRRLRFTVRFDEPSASQRAALWDKMLGGGLPVGEVDTVSLGRKFRFTGALIKNAVVRAAFYAADRGRPIDTAMLLEAGRAELHGQGRL